MKSRCRPGVALLISIFVLMPVATMADTYFVAPNGSDTASGTIESPYKTFLPALTRVKPGDTVLARGGTYTKDNEYICSGYHRVCGVEESQCLPGEVFRTGCCDARQYCMLSFSDFQDPGEFGDPFHTVQSGTAEAPITIKAYPGEKPVISSLVQFRDKSHFALEGFKIVSTFIYIAGGGSHDIVISRNEIASRKTPGGSNVGFIKVDPGLYAGPYNIFIRNNVLHDLADVTAPDTDWNTTADAQHFGSVAVQSREVYANDPSTGTGRIEITGNLIYNVPQAFYFKNPMRGPVTLARNVIFNAQSMGAMAASNVQIYENLIVNVASGFSTGGWGSSGAMLPLSSQSIHVERNTIVGPTGLFSLGVGSGYVVRNNVFFGLAGKVADWASELPYPLYAVHEFFETQNGETDWKNPAKSNLAKMDADTTA